MYVYMYICIVIVSILSIVIFTHTIIQIDKNYTCKCTQAGAKGPVSVHA